MEAPPPHATQPLVLERQMSEQESVRAAISTLREGTDSESILGDTDPESRNLAVAEAAGTLNDFIRERSLAKWAVEAGAIHAVVTALKLRPNSEAVQKTATITLGRLAALGSDEQHMAGEEGGVEAALGALTGHPNSIEVQQPAIQALNLLVTDNRSRNQRLAGEKGGIQAVVTALTQHSHSAVFQAAALSALAHMLASNSRNQLAATRAGSMSPVIGAMKSHPKSAEVQENGLRALGHLVNNVKENQTSAKEAGAIELALAELKRSQNCALMQGVALSTLERLVAEHKECQTQAMKGGGLEAVAHAMSEYSSDLHVQDNACMALCKLTKNNSKCQAHAQKVGLIDAVVRLARENVDSVDIQVAAARAIEGVVAGNSSNQKFAGRKGAIDMVHATLRAHQDNPLVLTCSLKALGELSLKSCENKKIARDLGVLTRVVAVLWQDPLEDETRDAAFFALRNLIVESQDNTKAVVALGGIEEVVAALKTGLILQRRRVSGVDLEVQNTPDLKTYQKLARESGLLEAAIFMLNQPPIKPQANGVPRPAGVVPQSSVMAMLADLVSENLPSQILAGELGAVSKIVSGLKTHDRNETVQEHGIGALTCLITHCAATQQLAKKASAEQVLHNSRDLHPGSVPVRQWINCCLEALRSGKVFMDQILSSEFGMRHQTCTPIPETAMRGITLDQLTNFDRFMQESLSKYDIVDTDPHSPAKGESIAWEQMTMYQVNHTFVKPLTKPHKCSYVEAIADAQQPPSWMISHWWGTTFAYTVKMLQLQASRRDRRNPGAVTYWCCTMANNQHNIGGELEVEDLLVSPFARAMLSQRCMGTVLLVDPQVTPLTRIWCVFEARVTQQLRRGMLADRTEKQRFFLDIVAPVVLEGFSPSDMRNIRMTMLQDAVGTSWHEVSDSPDVKFPLRVAEIGVTVDVRQARASHEEDRLAILNYVSHGLAAKSPPPLEHPKYDELNNFVHSVFASAELYRLACEQPEGCVTKIAELIELQADVNSFVREGNTALLAAAGADSTTRPDSTKAETQHEIVRLLLDHGANVNHVNSSQKTVLEHCDALPGQTRALLLEHEAKSYEEAIPELERQLNAQMAQLLGPGFGTEWQAFEGGSAGTKLRVPALRGLQAVASAVLKPYPWAVCTVCVQTSSKTQQKLAAARGESVMLALECAGCENVITLRFGAQSALVKLSVLLGASADASVEQRRNRGATSSKSTLRSNSEDRDPSPASSDAYSALEGNLGTSPARSDVRSVTFSGSSSFSRDDFDFKGSPKVIRSGPSLPLLVNKSSGDQASTPPGGSERRKKPLVAQSVSSLAAEDVLEMETGGDDELFVRRADRARTQTSIRERAFSGGSDLRDRKTSLAPLTPVLTKNQSQSTPALHGDRARGLPSPTPGSIVSSSTARSLVTDPLSPGISPTLSVRRPGRSQTTRPKFSMKDFQDLDG